jgi:hypothetical protein
MDRLNCIGLITATLIACVGCGSDGAQDGSTMPAPASPATPTAPLAPTQPPPPSQPTTPAGPTTPAPPPTPDQTTTSAGATQINDTDPSIIYSKGGKGMQNWLYFQPAQHDYREDEHSSRFVRGGGAITGVGAVITFKGTGITWIGKKGPQYGKAAYAVDGGAPQGVDNYNPTETDQVPDVTVSGLSADTHVLSIALLDQKHASAVDYWQTIDAFSIDGSALTPADGSAAGFNSAELKFKGSWGSGAVQDGSDLSGGHYWSNETNASISWTFIGSLIEVFGRPDYENGFMDVYIDTNPKPVASVNGHWGSVDDDSLNSYMLFAAKLAPGAHTIKVAVAGRHDPTARDNFVQVDEFLAFQ